MPVSVQAPSRLRFRDFALDLTSGELYKDGKKVALPPKAFEILRALVERPGEVVKRDELRARLWAGDTYVEFEDSLNHAVNKLRQALGDSSSNPQFIETLPRYGYRFIAPLDAPRAPGPATHRRAPITAVMLGVALLAVIAALLAFDVGGWRSRLSGSASRPAIHSLAVLPLSNLSGDPQQDYFADGMTDALITDLAKIHNLKVISRTSVMQFKDVKKPLPEIARALGVDGILEGSVQRSGGRVRVTAQLIRANTDTHLWAESYDRDARDVLALQGELAQAVAREIRVVLTPQESSRLASVRQVNPEAYEAYLKGHFEWYKISKQGFDDAERYFHLALEKDPNYALAYAGLADVWLMRSDSGYAAPSEMIPKATAAAHKALQLDENLAEAHVSLANTLIGYERDWTAAEREFRRAIELNPNSADAHFMYADFLISFKRNQEWQREIQKALTLDPMNEFLRCFYGWHLVYLGRYDEAVDLLQKVLTGQPNFSSAHLGLWGAYYKQGMEKEAMEEAVKFFEALHDQETAAALKAGYAVAGYRQGMKRAADTLALRAQRSHVAGVRIARLYAHAGQADQTLFWLQRAYVEHEAPLSHLGVAWDWDDLRSDPRFQDLLRRMGLPN